MLSGVEMLIKNVMAAAGIDPEKVRQEIADYGKQLGQKITSMDQSLAAIKEEQAALRKEFAVMYELLLNLSLKDRPVKPIGGIANVTDAAAIAIVPETDAAAIALMPNGGKKRA